MGVGKKFILLFLLSSLGCLPNFAQYKIVVRVNAMPTKKAYLYEFLGSRPSQMIDSTSVAANGIIRFELGKDAHPGMYRMVMGPQTWLDFVFNRENVEMETYFEAPIDSLKVISSNENQLWLEYMNFYLILNRKQDYLRRLQGLYKPTDGFYQEIAKELAGIQQTDPESASRRIIKENPDSYVARFLKAELSPQVPVGLSMKEELDYLLDHFFDEVDFTDTDLMYSPPLMSKINSFFGLYQQAFPPTEVEEKMIGGINRLLSLAAVNDDMYSFLLEQLTQLFERSEFETLFAYFTENFLLDGSCKDESRSQKLEEMLASIKKTEIGKQAPEIIVPLDSGPLLLSRMKSPYVLVLFWASWCPHCADMLPEIKRIYNTFKPKGFEVLAISLDSDKDAYEKALKEGSYSWINYSELKGWDCSIANDYGIRATPTMILLNKERKIIAKPRDPEMLRAVLESLF